MSVHSTYYENEDEYELDLRWEYRREAGAALPCPIDLPDEDEFEDWEDDYER